MARDNTGAFTLPNPPAEANTRADPVPLNGNLEEIRAGLSDSLSRSGKGGMQAALNMAGYSIANLADGAALADAVTVGQLTAVGNAIVAETTARQAQVAAEAGSRAAGDAAERTYANTTFLHADGSLAWTGDQNGGQHQLSNLGLVSSLQADVGIRQRVGGEVNATSGAGPDGLALYGAGQTDNTGVVLHVVASPPMDSNAVAVFQRRNQGGGGTVSGQVLQFRTATTQCGSIQIQFGNQVAYSTSSDYRLKRDVEPLAGAAAAVLALEAKSFIWLADEAGRRVSGFLAHEVQAVAPEAALGAKDAEDDEGNPIFQAVDASKLVPILWGAVRELLQRVTELESKA